MRRGKTVARILLFFSVANVALAAPAIKPAIARQRYLKGAAPEKLVRSDNEMAWWMFDDPALGSPAGSSHQDLASYHDSAPAASASSNEGSAHASSGLSDEDPAPELPSSSSHQGVTAESASSPSHQDLTPELPPSSSHRDLAPPESTFLDSFFNDEMKKRIGIFSALSAVVGTVGVTYEVQKNAKRIVSPSAYVSALFLPTLANIYSGHKHVSL